LWVDGGWPGNCHEHELMVLSGLGKVLAATAAASLLDQGFRSMAKTREHWLAPVGDRRTKDLKGAQSRTWPVRCMFASVARYGDAPAILTRRPPWCPPNSPT
jgi:hypothetical protein